MKWKTTPGSSCGKLNQVLVRLLWRVFATVLATIVWADHKVEGAGRQEKARDYSTRSGKATDTRGTEKRIRW